MLEIMQMLFCFGIGVNFSPFDWHFGVNNDRDLGRAQLAIGPFTFNLYYQGEFDKWEN